MMRFAFGFVVGLATVYHPLLGLALAVVGVALAIGVSLALALPELQNKGHL